MKIADFFGTMEVKGVEMTIGASLVGLRKRDERPSHRLRVGKSGGRYGMLFEFCNPN